MKKLEFETSKGKFVLMDFPLGKKNVYMNKFKGISLKEITEEQASEIVDSKINSVFVLLQILALKDIFLFKNPLQTAYQFDQSVYEYHQAEQKTFYNPYIFKL